MSDNDEDMPKERKDLGFRTSWSSVLGQLVVLSLVNPDTGLESSNKLFDTGFDKGSAEGRITGVDATGVWFEPLELVEDFHAGMIGRENIFHIFIPFANIRCVETFPVEPGPRPGRG